MGERGPGSVAKLTSNRTFRLMPALAARLDALAARHYTTPSAICREALRLGLDRMEADDRKDGAA